MTAPAVDDIVSDWEAAHGNERVPLLVLEPLARFLDEHGLGGGELRVSPMGEGRSNVIYLIDRDDIELVLRRPPRPPLPPSAHDVLREARILGALAGTVVRIPRLLAACDDESVIGAPFYVMERIAGEVIIDHVPAPLDDPLGRAAVSEELARGLAELHAVDWRATPLVELARPTSYLERQLRRFTGLWDHNRTRDVPDIDATAAWLEANRPAAAAETVVHGDYRLGNVVYSPEAPARLLAILDWEMATIGDPLADVGYLSAMWIEAGDPDRGMYEVNGITRLEGFLRREDLVAAYERASGRAVDDVRYYEVLALWKSAIFMEGNFRRAQLGLSDDPYLKGFGDGVLELAARARLRTNERTVG
jgi:aminoglycoside phosphotransferase (APT) family kinase protein